MFNFQNKTDLKMKTAGIVKTILAFLLSFILAVPVSFAAAVPNLISLQGRLTDPVGVNKPDGVYELSFKLYNQQNGGTSVWQETQQNVTCKNGIFQVNLGELNNLKDYFTGQDLWLEITVTKDGISETLIPRQRLASVGDSFRSETANTVESVPDYKIIASGTKIANLNSDLLDGKHASDFIDTSLTSQTKNSGLNILGNLGVGKI